MRSAAAVPAMICLIIVSGVAPASDFQSASLPPNLISAPVFHPSLEKMLQLSPTFRRQCRRLAGAAHLRVNLALEELSRRPSHLARSDMQYRNGLLASVDIHLTRFDQPALIAHEIEHVIEQLDGIDLGVHIRAGTVWRREDGAFETRRATEVGRRVAQEVSLRPAAATQPLTVQQHASWRPLGIAAQHDPFASVHDPPSARVSAGDRYVVFASYARLSPLDRNTMRDIYVLDLLTRLVTLETRGAAGPSNGDSFNADISGDGRYIVFESSAGNLTNGELAPGVPRVFWRDRQLGITRLLSTTPAGEPANGMSMTPAISADGTTAVFTSSATNLVDDKTTNGGIGVYRIELSSNSRLRVDVTPDGRGHMAQSASPTISGDGRYVAFASDADLTTHDRPAGRDEPRDRNGVFDVYVRDLLNQRTRRASAGAYGSDSDGPSYHPAISRDGRHVVFVSEASNLTSARNRSPAQVFVRDMETGTIEMVTRTAGGRPGDGPSAWPAVSGDGSVIAYQSLASNLLCENRCAANLDSNLLWDVYVYDRLAHHTSRASGDPSASEEWMENSRGPSLDGRGRVLTFSSTHPRSPEDEAHDENLFVLESTRTRDVTTGSSR